MVEVSVVAVVAERSRNLLGFVLKILDVQHQGQIHFCSSNGFVMDIIWGYDDECW